MKNIFKPIGAILGLFLLTLGFSAQANVIRIDQTDERAFVDCDSGLTIDCQGAINNPGVWSDLYADVYVSIGGNSNLKSETDFLNALFGLNLKLGDATKIESNSDEGFFKTTAAYFAIKTGAGWSFFKNTGGEIDLTVVYTKGADGQGLGLSHVTFWGGSTTDVPEPGTLALLGMGILGFGLMRRRRAV